ncbi:response regulator transcription factor [Egbenema bharatensis]|uniref:response regulator transcription factor n=1 Tax=Egbenema bharatensis TaxID=3463334 RepID=UPI003A8794EF
MQKTVNQSASPKYTHSIHLSDREREILELIVEGQTNQQIASQLFLSLSTVKTHVKSIFNKMGVEHRVQAAVMALRYELI